MPRLRSNNNEVGRQLTELRRSNAAGIHNHQPTRSETKRRAIQMSEFDGDYAGLEPTKEDLLDIEAEVASTKDSDRIVNFDPEEYEFSKNGSDDFTSYQPDEERYEVYDEEDEDWNEDGEEAEDGSYSVKY
jgi:hypothetical protein